MKTFYLVTFRIRSNHRAADGKARLEQECRGVVVTVGRVVQNEHVKRLVQIDSERVLRGRSRQRRETLGLLLRPRPVLRRRENE